MATSGLREYASKRIFTRTAEPRGKLSRRSGHLFVVQKHWARRLHYDLRLELDGVLKSWAVTRGPSLSPKDKRLAVRVEDHPLDYAEFEGRIPQGEYGAGSVIVWDRGRWSTDGDPRQQLAKGHLEFELEGTKLKGRWHLVHMQGRDRGGKENWLLIKAHDAYASEAGNDALLEDKPRSVKTGRTVEDVARSRIKIKRKRGSNDGSHRLPEHARKAHRSATTSHSPSLTKLKAAKSGPMPTFVEPQLASPTDHPPPGSAWVHEIKFDGYRILARVDRGRVTLKTRGGRDWTSKFPSLKHALEALPVVTAFLDGEVIVEREHGTPDFGALEADLSEGRSDRFSYYLFDLLYLDGTDLRGASLLDRKAALARLLVGRDGGPLRFSEHFTERGEMVFTHACRLSLEGIVSKLKHAPYRCGRSRSWLKSKCIDSDEFIIIGYVPSTTQARAVGALALGYFDRGKLIYAGRVGSGFSTSAAEDLWRRLEAIRLVGPALAVPPPSDVGRNVRWTRPSLVAEVALRGWTADGIMRHAVFRGLRQDKQTDDVAAERPTMRSKGRKGAAELPLPLTHPDRVLWPDAGVTKLGLAEFHMEVWPWMAPHVVGRPLALVRCPGGIADSCFFQKHAWAGISEHIRRGRDPESGEELLSIRDVKGLIGLTQASALEIHVWGAKLDTIEKPDGITFDLDPAPEVEWGDVVAAAFEVRDRLRRSGLDSFVKTTGGKGLHVYAPLEPYADWAAVKDFAHRLALAMANDSPQRYLVTAAKRARRRRIFLDYLRNGRGATAVVAYSARARAGAPVSTPLAWEELGPDMRPDRFTILNLLHRLDHIDDPWQDLRRNARRLPAPRH
jgi:bifunctional non-homologous end joining protein LigD